MRLIDADKIAFFDCLAKTGNSVCCHTEGIVSKRGIDEQPTVDAIPVEWIRQWYKSREYLTEGKTAICRMIWDWEKENETNAKC